MKYLSFAWISNQQTFGGKESPERSERKLWHAWSEPFSYLRRHIYSFVGIREKNVRQSVRKWKAEVVHYHWFCAEDSFFFHFYILVRCQHQKWSRNNTSARKIKKFYLLTVLLVANAKELVYDGPTWVANVKQLSSICELYCFDALIRLCHIQSNVAYTEHTRDLSITRICLLDYRNPVFNFNV